MRIDNTDRAPQAQTTERPQAPVERSKTGQLPAISSDPVDVSPLARALDSADPRRLEHLRLQVQSGTYQVDAQATAGSMIDEHSALAIQPSQPSISVLSNRSASPSGPSD